MSARLARLALALYPLAYRRRYGEEMEALIEDTGATPRAVVDLARGAFRAHLAPEPALTAALDDRDRLRLAASTVLLCWVIFAAAILGFAKTTEEPDFSAAASAHGLLGGAHLALQLLAVLGSLALLLGAGPLLVIALAQVRRRPGVRRATLLAVGCVAVLVAATAAVVLLANHGGVGAGVRDWALVAWAAIGLACALGIAAAARHGLFAAAVPDDALRLARACTVAVATAMVGVALATALYLAALLADAPSLAGQANGPAGLLSVGASVAVCLVVMALAAAAGSVSALRTRRAILT